jgi:hypothetical protein
VIKMQTPIKAYKVIEAGEGYGTIAFATNNATARRTGASELDVEWGDIESCRRQPDMDQYAPGPIHPLTLIDHGWCFECSHCGSRVSDVDQERRADARLGVFCSESCECADHMRDRHREEAADALREVFEAKFPGAHIEQIGAYASFDSPRLKANSGGDFVVTFMFPGGQHCAQWAFGSEHCWVMQSDMDAYVAWRPESQHPPGDDENHG